MMLEGPGARRWEDSICMYSELLLMRAPLSSESKDGQHESNMDIEMALGERFKVPLLLVTITEIRFIEFDSTLPVS